MRHKTGIERYMQPVQERNIGLIAIAFGNTTRRQVIVPRTFLPAIFRLSFLVRDQSNNTTRKSAALILPIMHL